MRKLFILGSFAAVLAFAATAAADARTPASGPGLWSELPQGSLPGAPKTPAPARVNGGERVEGITIQTAPGMPAEMAFVTSPPPKPKPGEKPRAPGRFGILGGDGFAEQCFSNADRDTLSAKWATQSDSTLPLQKQQGVVAVRAEKFDEKADGAASLVVTDAWVDPITNGVRAISKRDLALKMVREAPGGIKVYMMRDTAEAEMLVVFPKDQKFIPWQLIGERSDGTIVHSSGCRHLHVPLAAEKGRGESVVVRAPSVLGTETGSRPEFPQLKRVRFRTLVVAASTSWLGRDAEPVVSLSVGWEGRERTVERAIGDEEDSGF